MLNSQAKKLSLDSFPEAIIIYKNDGTIAYSNKKLRKLLGFLEKDLSGNSIELLIPSWKKNLVSVAETSKGVITADDISALRKDESLLVISVSQNKIDIDGEEMFIASIKEVYNLQNPLPENKTLDETNRQIQKMESLGLLTCNIAHDFNNMLYVILGNVELAISSTSSASPLASNFTDIKTATLHLTDLSKQVLLYAGGGSQIKADINITDIIKEMLQLLQVSFSSKVAVEYNLKEKMPSINAVPSQVRQVILNFVTNAAEAISKQKTGNISITTGMIDINDHNHNYQTFNGKPLLLGRYAYFEVSDNGSGIEEKNLGKIFDPFFSTKATSGRGLGLSSVMGILRNHNGAITITSTLHEGATFRALFPCNSLQIEQAFDEYDLNMDLGATESDTLDLMQDYFDRPGC